MAGKKDKQKKAPRSRAVPKEAERASRAREAAWWNARRETAYALFMQGVPAGEVAEQTGTPPRTLFKWRQHEYWQVRVVADQVMRRRVFAEMMQDIETRAVVALPAHVVGDARACLEFLGRRGILPAAAAKVEVKRPVQDAIESVKELTAEELRAMIALHTAEGRGRAE